MLSLGFKVDGLIGSFEKIVANGVSMPLRIISCEIQRLMVKSEVLKPPELVILMLRAYAGGGPDWHHGFTCIYLAPFSPELKHIERFWYVVKSKIRRERSLAEATLSSGIVGKGKIIYHWQGISFSTNTPRIKLVNAETYNTFEAQFQFHPYCTFSKVFVEYYA